MASFHPPPSGAGRGCAARGHMTIVEEAGLRSLILGGTLVLGHCGLPQHPLTSTSLNPGVLVIFPRGLSCPNMSRSITASGGGGLCTQPGPAPAPPPQGSCSPFQFWHPRISAPSSSWVAWTNRKPRHGQGASPPGGKGVMATGILRPGVHEHELGFQVRDLRKSPHRFPPQLTTEKHHWLLS